MTQEEKAKRYDDAIKQLRTMMPNWENLSYNGKTFLQDLVHIFPELKEESEDERIRKALIKYYSFDKDGGSHALDNITPKQIVTWLEKQCEQKPAWSEEDNKMSRFIGNAITGEGASIYLESKGIQIIDAHVWLDELKDRVQPKQEWSDYDECMLTNLIDDPHCSIDSEYVHWLKSIKERYTWRPSDEQIKAIKWIIDGDNPENWSITLKNFYQDLKKLREE